MAQESLIPPRLRELLNAVFEELATKEQLDELQRILQADEQAREIYLNQCRTHVGLYFAAREQKMLAQAVDAIIEPKASIIEPKASMIEPKASMIEPKASMIEPKAPASKPPAAPAIAPPAKSPVLGFLGGVMDYVNHSRMLMFWLVALFVGSWFAFQLGSLMLGRARPGGAKIVGQPANSNSQEVSHPPGGSFANSAPARQRDSVAFMTTIIDCHWRVVPPAAPPASAPAPGDADTVLYNGEPFHVGSELSAGQQLDLVRGLAEITFRSGARIVLNGPAHFTVGSPLGGKLQIGKLTARVPHDAHGFTVNTPAGKVVDLGTEFGVAVAANHTMDVEVFVGEVAVDSSAADGQTPSSPSTAPTKPQKLTAGHAAHVEVGKPVATIPLDPNRFVRGLGPREDSHVAQAAYLDFVRSLKPVVWFRMEGQDKDRVLHDEMGGPDAKLFWDGPGNPFVAGRAGKALWLRGSQLRDCAVVPSYPQAGHGKLSVAAWVYAQSHPANATILANWKVVTGSGQFYFGVRTGGLVALVSQANGRQTVVNEGADQGLPLNEWQHVAFTTDGTTLRLYRQGREVSSAKHVGLLHPSPIPGLGIGTYFDKSGKAPAKGFPGCWDGKLDEVALFDDVLSADDIHKLAEAPP